MQTRKKKVKLHKDRLDASLRQLDCGMLKTLPAICDYVQGKRLQQSTNNHSHTGGEGPFASTSLSVIPPKVDVRGIIDGINAKTNEPLYTIKRAETTPIIETKPEKEKKLPDDDDEFNDDEEEKIDVVGVFNVIKDYLIELSSECSKEMFLDAENNVIQDKNKHIEDLILQFNEEHLNLSLIHI